MLTLINMNKNESIRQWFNILEREGEYTNILVYAKKDLDGEIIENSFPHADYDGISAINQFLLKNNLSQDNIEIKIPEREFPSKLYQWLMFFKFVSRLPYKSASWNFEPTGWEPYKKPTTPKARAWKIVSKKDTKKIEANAKSHKVHLNSYLLYHLDLSIQKYLVGNEKQRVWFMPVSLRNSNDKGKSGNLVSFIDIYMRNQSISDVNSEIRKELLSGAFFGGYIGFTLGTLIGQTLLEKLVELNHKMQIRTGVFTNLGKWEQPNNTFRFGGIPPVVRSQPFGALVGGWLGELTLNCVYHPILTDDHTIAEETLENWIVSLLRDQKDI